MDIIPGLPNDIAFDCLIRVPFSKLHSLRSVCKAWKSEIRLSELLRLRKSVGKAQCLFVFALKMVNEFKFLVFEPETGSWSEMPPLPNGCPGYEDCKIVVVGSYLVVIGGCNEQDRTVDSVFIFEFLTCKWRRGTNIPDGGRGAFGCATDGDRTVFVAGGYNKKDSTSDVTHLKSAWTYDVTTDNWNQLLNMTRERSFCEGLFLHGKFHAIHGYPTNMHPSLETFDMSTGEWLEKYSMFSCFIRYSCICVVGSDQKVYKCHDEYILVLEDDSCQYFKELPIEMEYPDSIIPSVGHLWLKGRSKSDRRSIFFKMDMEERIWKKLEIPAKYFDKYHCYVYSNGCLSL